MVFTISEGIKSTKGKVFTPRTPFPVLGHLSSQYYLSKVQVTHVYLFNLWCKLEFFVYATTPLGITFKMRVQSLP